MLLMMMIRTFLLLALCLIVGASFFVVAAETRIFFEDEEGACGGSDEYAVGTTTTRSNDDDGGGGGCTGYFCDKYLSSMFIFMTHNSYATEDRVYANNQNRYEGDQFADGIRGFNFDIYDEDGELAVDHTPMGETWSPSPYTESVDQILEQMDKCRYRNEIVIVEFEMKKTISGTHRRAAEAWGDRVITDFDPTVPFSRYIARGQRVLLLTNKNYTYPSIGIHRRSDFIVQNGYEWTCEMNYPDFSYREGPRDDPHSAKLMNHFCSTFRLPDERESEKANDPHTILHNARMFAEQPDFGHAMPNIISVDFYDRGDIWPVQDLIRGGEEYVGDEWDDGNVCTPWSTCWRCKNPHTFWQSKLAEACGAENFDTDTWCVADGNPCDRAASPCGAACCSGTHEYWYSKSANTCGTEPCWASGTSCRRWISCNACCNSDDKVCPWWGIFGCRCG